MQFDCVLLPPLLLSKDSYISLPVSELDRLAARAAQKRGKKNLNSNEEDLIMVQKNMKTNRSRAYSTIQSQSDEEDEDKGEQSDDYQDLDFDELLNENRSGRHRTGKEVKAVGGLPPRKYPVVRLIVRGYNDHDRDSNKNRRQSEKMLKKSPKKQISRKRKVEEEESDDEVIVISNPSIRRSNRRIDSDDDVIVISRPSTGRLNRRIDSDKGLGRSVQSPISIDASTPIDDVSTSLKETRTSAEPRLRHKPSSSSSRAQKAPTVGSAFLPSRSCSPSYSAPPPVVCADSPRRSATPPPTQTSLPSLSISTSTTKTKRYPMNALEKRMAQPEELVKFIGPQLTMWSVDGTKLGSVSEPRMSGEDAAKTLMNVTMLAPAEMQPQDNNVRTDADDTHLNETDDEALRPLYPSTEQDHAAIPEERDDDVIVIESISQDVANRRRKTKPRISATPSSSDLTRHTSRSHSRPPLKARQATVQTQPPSSQSRSRNNTASEKRKHPSKAIAIHSIADSTVRDELSKDELFNVEPDGVQFFIDEEKSYCHQCRTASYATMKCTNTLAKNQKLCTARYCHRCIHIRLVNLVHVSILKIQKKLPLRFLQIPEDRI